MYLLGTLNSNFSTTVAKKLKCQLNLTIKDRDSILNLNIFMTHS